MKYKLANLDQMKTIKKDTNCKFYIVLKYWLKLCHVILNTYMFYTVDS